MKVLVQSIGRYQDTTPLNIFVELEGDKLTDQLVLECLVKSNHCPDMEDAQEMMEYHTDDNLITRDEQCVCFWGEEDDCIITVIG